MTAGPPHQDGRLVCFGGALPGVFPATCRDVGAHRSRRIYLATEGTTSENKLFTSPHAAIVKRKRIPPPARKCGRMKPDGDLSPMWKRVDSAQRKSAQMPFVPKPKLESRNQKAQDTPTNDESRGNPGLRERSGPGDGSRSRR